MGNIASMRPGTKSTANSNKRRRLNPLDTNNNSLFSNVVKAVLAPKHSSGKHDDLIPDDVRQHVMGYLSHRQIKILEMTSTTTRRIVKEHCQPIRYGRDIEFDGDILKFVPQNNNGDRSWTCNRGGVIGYNGMCTETTKIKLLATTDFRQQGYKLTVGFMRQPDSMTDFTVRSESSAESDYDNNSINDDSSLSTVESYQETATGFRDFHIPQSCTYPSQYWNKIHRFYAEIFICRQVRLLNPLQRRRLGANTDCHVTNILRGFKDEGHDVRVTTQIFPSGMSCYHTEHLRGLSAPQHVTIILSRIDSNKLRIHVKIPHHMTADEHIIIHRYTEVSNNVDGPYTWFVELGPCRNENGSIKIT